MLALLLALGPQGTQPFYPHFHGRRVALLDVEVVWHFGFDPDFGDASRPLGRNELRAIATPATATVPSAFDVAAPGVAGRRGTGFYRARFELTPGRHARLRFAACSFYCRVFVDAVDLKQHRSGGYTPFWVDVPPSNSSQRDLLVMADNRFSKQTAPVHTGGDFYEYGGLTRSVLLHELLPGPHIESLDAVPVGMDRVEIRLAVTTDETADPMGVMTSATIRFDDQQTAAWVGQVGPSGRVSVELTVPAPQQWTLWTEGTPALHTVSVLLGSGDGATARFGLRQLSVSSEGQLQLNGAFVKLRGFNRHTMAPDTGSALTLAQVEHDLALLREVGANFVRGAHYPQDQRFLDLCDEAGIGVWEETLGPATSVESLTNPDFLRAQNAQVHEMVSASLSHPSILMHGFFNEGPSQNQLACAAYAASADAIRQVAPSSHRLVTWATSAKEHDLCLEYADIISFNDYPGWYRGTMASAASVWRNHVAWAKAAFPTKPFIISETGAAGIWEWSDNISASTGKAEPPRWSQAYQRMLVLEDAKTGLADPNISGIVLWQLTDIKADDAANKACGSCAYAKPYNASTPMDCAFISPRCWRPGGENHKGSVDFWRRKKQSFGAVKELFQHYYSTTRGGYAPISMQ